MHIDRWIEQALTPAFDGFAIVLIFDDIAHKAVIETHFVSSFGIDLVETFYTWWSIFFQKNVLCASVMNQPNCRSGIWPVNAENASPRVQLAASQRTFF